MFESSIVFKTAVDQGMLEFMAKRMLKSHVALDGRFGQDRFRGKLGLFKSLKDRQEGRQGKIICLVVYSK